MKEFIKNKGIGSYLAFLAGLIFLAMTIVYGIFMSSYGIFSGATMFCLIAAVILDVVVIVFNTPFDSLIRVVSVFFSSFALGLFLGDCALTISDNINGVLCYGSFAPMEGIVAITIVMGIGILITLIGCFFKKDKA